MYNTNYPYNKLHQRPAHTVARHCTTFSLMGHRFAVTTQDVIIPVHDDLKADDDLKAGRNNYI